MQLPASVNKFRVFTLHEIAAFTAAAAAAFILMFPEHTLTELVNREKNTAVTIKYLNSIVRINQDNKYKFLLADTYLAAGLYAKALVAVNTIHPENLEVLFRKDLYTLAILERYEKKNAGIDRQLAGLKAVISARLNATREPELLALAYRQSLQAKAYFAAALAAGKLSGTSGKNRPYWLEKAATAQEKDNNLKAAAGLYLQLALVTPDQWTRRLSFKKSFDELAAAGAYAEMKTALSRYAPAFAGDRHTAATMLRYSRMTGDAALSRRVALAILNGGAI
jgi:hypothetical protein